MYFHVCKKNYSASPGQHIFMFLVSFERLMNKAIDKIFSIQFHACTLKLQVFKKKKKTYDFFRALFGQRHH